MAANKANLMACMESISLGLALGILGHEPTLCGKSQVQSFFWSHHMRLLGKALTFDDVLLVPAYSEVLPKDVSSPPNSLAISA
jgi:hypothetical protein